MFSADTKRKRFTKWRIDLATHNALAIACKKKFERDFRRLLTVVSSRSGLLRPLYESGYAGWMHAERYLRALLAFTEHRKNWLRDVDSWESPNANSLEQFGSLARHLLARHSVPNFMTLVWFEEPTETARRHQKLFKHLGLGNSIRGANLPICLTKSMADFFEQAPDHLTVEQAVRWSQVRGLGGSKQFASAVLSTRLGTVFEHESFWARVLQLLVAQPKLNVDLVPPIIEFVNIHRAGLMTQSFHKMSRRSFNSFLGRVQQWMDRNPSYGLQAKLRWPRTSIGGFRHVEPRKHEWSVRYWTIRELTDSQQLIDEGNGLHHCVATYANACAERATSIWSLRCHGSLESHQVLTMEVIPEERKIVTALGKCNSPPKPDARGIMEKWAEQEGLTISKWV